MAYMAITKKAQETIRVDVSKGLFYVLVVSSSGHCLLSVHGRKAGQYTQRLVAGNAVEFYDATVKPGT